MRKGTLGGKMAQLVSRKKKKKEEEDWKGTREREKKESVVVAFRKINK